MKILVIYDCDNGYKCSCCNQSWEETEIYDIGDPTGSLKDIVEQKEKEAFASYNSGNKYGRHSVLGAYVISETIREY